MIWRLERVLPEDLLLNVCLSYLKMYPLRKPSNRLGKPPPHGFTSRNGESWKSSRLYMVPIPYLPLLTQILDVPTSNRPELFIQKLDQCNVIFDFRDPSMDIRSKEIKRSTLQELLDYISNNRNVIQPNMYGKIVHMVPHLLPTRKVDC